MMMMMKRIYNMLKGKIMISCVNNLNFFSRFSSCFVDLTDEVDDLSLTNNCECP